MGVFVRIKRYKIFMKTRTLSSRLVWKVKSIRQKL